MLTRWSGDLMKAASMSADDGPTPTFSPILSQSGWIGWITPARFEVWKRESWRIIDSVCDRATPSRPESSARVESPLPPLVPLTQLRFWSPAAGAAGCRNARAPVSAHVSATATETCGSRGRSDWICTAGPRERAIAPLSIVAARPSEAYRASWDGQQGHSRFSPRLFEVCRRAPTRARPSAGALMQPRSSEKKAPAGNGSSGSGRVSLVPHRVRPRPLRAGRVLVGMGRRLRAHTS